jgi:hypothetical protein
MTRRITKKNASTRLWHEFVGHSEDSIRVAKTTKNVKRQVVGIHIMKGKIWRERANGFGEWPDEEL